MSRRRSGTSSTDLKRQSLRLCARPNIFGKLGATRNMEASRDLFRKIEQELDTPVASGQSGFDCELLQVVPLPACILTLRSKLREPSESVDDRVKFFKFIFIHTFSRPGYRDVIRCDYCFYPSLF
jgi:hypothetical protein